METSALYDENGELLSIRKLMDRLNCTNHQARKLLDAEREFLKEVNQLNNPQSQIPASKLWTPARKILSLSDVHIPYHDKDALDRTLYYMMHTRFDDVILNGDVMDCESISDFHSLNPTPLHVEIDMTKKFIDQVAKIARKNNKNVNLTYISGNHEDRLKRYIAKNARSLAGIKIDEEELVSIPHLLSLGQREWTHVDYFDHIELPGHLFVQHGNSVSAKAGYSVANAMSKLSGSIVMGHVHRIGSSYITNRIGTFIGIEQGCLCLTDPSYMHKKQADWQTGFAIASYTEDNKYFIEQAYLQPQSKQFLLGGFLW